MNKYDYDDTTASTIENIVIQTLYTFTFIYIIIYYLKQDKIEIDFSDF